MTISLDEQAAVLAERSAAAEGLSLSAWLSRAALGQARIEEGLRGVAEYEAAYGAPTEVEMDGVRRELAELGFGGAENPDDRVRRLAALSRFYGKDIADNPEGVGAA